MSQNQPAPKAAQPVQQKSTPNGAPSSTSAGASRGAVQLKRSLEGLDFAQQEAMLAPPSGPVQMRGESTVPPVQADGGGGEGNVHAAAEAGVTGGGSRLPHLGAIQGSFGKHDVSSVQAYQGSAASSACDAMGASAYASGDKVAFGGAGADLHTAAHEAAHVVQQRAGVSLAGGVGQSGDRYEQHADAVADAVVSGKSAEGVLDQMAPGAGDGAQVQAKAVQREGEGEGAETVEFGEDEVDVIDVATFPLAAGARPYDLLQNYWNAVCDMIDVMGTNHLAGIANFIDTMQFEGSQSGRADVVGAIFKSVGKGLLDSAIDGAAGLVPIPGFSLLVGWVKGAVEAATTEIERAATAAGSAGLAAYGRSLRGDAASSYGAARISFRTTAESQLPAAFEALDGTVPATPAEGNNVTGDKATMLRNMDAHRASLRSAIPAASAFQDGIVSRWVTSAGAGGAGTSSDHGRDLTNGYIRVWVDSENDDDRWSFEVERATVYTASHGPQAADLLREELSSGRKTLWNCGVPVRVMFHGPNNMPGGRTWFECRVSGPGAASGSGPWWPEADVGWRLLLNVGSKWREMETMARSSLEGSE